MPTTGMVSRSTAAHNSGLVESQKVRVLAPAFHEEGEHALCVVVRGRDGACLDGHHRWTYEAGDGLLVTPNVIV